MSEVEDIRDWVKKSRKAQGLPEQVENSEVLKNVATLLEKAA